jgi:photosystem II stability/assembly factor-like uncharacterized protein
MKKNYIFYTFAVLIFYFSVIINADLYSQQFILAGMVQNPGTEPSISVVDADNVWIAGGVPDTPRVYRTTNGGLNWIPVPVNGISKEIFCIWAVNANTVFVGEGIVNGNARLFKTTNAGVNWTSVLQTGQNEGNFNNLIFSRINPLVGGVLADEIYISTNGGNNWVKKNTGASGVSSAQNSLMLVDGNFFGFGFKNGASRVRTSTDGGSSWSNQNVGITGNYTSGYAYKDDKLIGLASTSTSMPNLARTTDGGTTWNSLSIGTGLTGNTLIKWVSGTNVVYIIGANGAIKRSINSGLNWSSMSTAGISGITHFSFIKLNGIIHGYAVSSNGSVMKLADSVLILTGINNLKIPAEYKLLQNYPNPFNPETNIEYSLPVRSNVLIKVYDVMGREVRTLVNETKPGGNYSVKFDASDLSSGLYFYKIQTDKFYDAKCMLLVK